MTGSVPDLAGAVGNEGEVPCSSLGSTRMQRSRRPARRARDLRDATASRPARRSPGFGGNVVDRAEFDTLDEELAHALVADRRQLYMVSLPPFAPADLVNHSCEPNCGIIGSCLLVAMRDIEVGEELCFDYAMTDTNDYDEFVCACGTPSCRGLDHRRRLEAARAAGALRGVLLVLHHAQDRGDRGHRALSAHPAFAGRRSARPPRGWRTRRCRPRDRRRTRLRCAARPCCPCRGTRRTGSPPAPYARYAVLSASSAIIGRSPTPSRRSHADGGKLFGASSTRVDTISMSSPAGQPVGLQPLREPRDLAPGSAGTSARRRRSPWPCRRRQGWSPGRRRSCCRAGSARCRRSRHRLGRLRSPGAGRRSRSRRHSRRSRRAGDDDVSSSPPPEVSTTARSRRRRSRR